MVPIIKNNEIFTLNINPLDPMDNKVYKLFLSNPKTKGPPSIYAGHHIILLHRRLQISDCGLIVA